MIKLKKEDYGNGSIKEESARTKTDSAFNNYEHTVNKTKNDVMKWLFGKVYKNTSYFGWLIFKVFCGFFVYVGKGAAYISKFLWRSTGRFRRYIILSLKKLVQFLLRPLNTFIRYYEGNKKALHKEKEKNGGKLGIKGAVMFSGRLLFGKSGLAVMLFNCAIPVVSVFFLLSVITYANSLNYAVKLNVNGKFLGYIESEQVFLDAKEVLQDRVNYLGSDLEIEAVPSYSVEQIGYTETLTKYQIADLVLQNSGVSLEYGYGFFINDVFYGALMDFSNVKNTLDKLLADYQNEYSTDLVAFVDDIRYDEAGLYLSDSIIDEDWLIDLITSIRKEPSYYTAEEGDSSSLISDKVNLSLSQLELLNPGFGESELHGGDQIKIGNEIPFLPVSVTRTEVYVVDNVPYMTDTYQDNDIFEGSSRRIQDGEYGVNEVTADISYVNGIETHRTITNINQLVAPVTEIVAIGSKPAPEGSYKAGTAAIGKFLWPVDGGHISQWSQWDGGYDGHNGIDIAGLYYGQPVYVGAAGVVTFAGHSRGLGYYIEIYHEELGVTSTYAHNSVLYVTEGQRVAQGECIAGAGSTGKSTGTHVHFTIQVNGKYVNPKDYLDIPPGTPEILV